MAICEDIKWSRESRATAWQISNRSDFSGLYGSGYLKLDVDSSSSVVLTIIPGRVLLLAREQVSDIR